MTRRFSCRFPFPLSPMLPEAGAAPAGLVEWCRCWDDGAGLLVAGNLGLRGTPCPGGSEDALDEAGERPEESSTAGFGCESRLLWCGHATDWKGVWVEKRNLSLLLVLEKSCERELVRGEEAVTQQKKRSCCRVPAEQARGFKEAAGACRESAEWRG